MNIGESLTRGTVWIALPCYTVVEAVRLSGPMTRQMRSALRWFWTLGCAAYIGHVIAAFRFYHGWSHAAAYAETAHQTNALTGLNWGGGLYFNYAFSAVWMADALWWWIGPTSYGARRHGLTSMVRAFFFFMVLNSTIVFGRGAARALGATILLLLVVAWFWSKPRNRRQSNQT